MIIQPIIAGVALAGRTVLSKQSTHRAASLSRPAFKPRSRPRPRPSPTPIHMKKKNTLIHSPLQNVLQGISSTLSNITQKPPEEDFGAIVKRLMPEHSQHLSPKNPIYSKNFQFADLDNDRQNELIASYKLGDEITTMIIKKQDSNWRNIAQITNPGYDSINYMTFADFAGLGTKQLLLGLKSRDGYGMLYGYTMQNGEIQELFSQKYNRIEVLESPANNRAAPKAQLAFWHSTNQDSYDVDVMQWNGSALEPLKSQEPYYKQRVVPYYLQKIKQSPQIASNWYCLADILEKSGLYRDGLIAVEYGMSINSDSQMADKFLLLRKSIVEKI